MDDGIKKRVLPWLGFFVILVVYCVSVLQFNPQDLFGATQDDSLYFSSAKALATQQGYILPSVPSEPIATKYPILYPWILSWVWRWNPEFPSNLRDAIAINLFFGAIFLVCSFIYLRRLKGLGDSAALFLTLFVALHPFVLYYSASVLSDIPFAALAFMAMLIADQAMDPNATSAKTAGCGFLTGLSILMRAFGVPVAAGILAAAVARRAWRQVAIFCGTLAPFGGAMVWRSLFVHSSVPVGSGGMSREPGFVAAWTYYTSYPGIWRLSIPNTHILWAMLGNNAMRALRSPADFFLDPLLTQNGIAAKALILLVTAGIVAGMVRNSWDRTWRSIYWVFPFYVALILVWIYPETGRFSLLFLPLFAGALWIEIKHFLALLYATVAEDHPRMERALAGILAFGVAALICAMAVNYAYGDRRIMAETVRNRSSLLREKREAYQWISCCTSRDDKIIAYEDASVYLYSGRQSMRPVIFPTSGLYDSEYIQESLAHMTDVAHVIGARYWLISDDDFAMEWDRATSLGRMREVELQQTLPVVFQSHDGHVWIYKLDCDSRSQSVLCP